MTKKLSLILVFFLLVSGGLRATHLVGGNLAYEFIQGIDSDGNGTIDKFEYKITLNYYFDCGSNSNWIPDPSDPTSIPGSSGMDIAVYAHNDPTNAFPTTSGSYPKYSDGSSGGTDYKLYFTTAWPNSYETFTPDNPPNCSVGISACIYTVQYSNTITLEAINPLTGAPAIGGYHIVHERCCRNGGANGITNIQTPGGAGMAFYAYIPPFGYENSTPVFTDPPVPFICAQDTTTFLNSAIDPDGDELIFERAAPFDGNWADAFGGTNQVGGGGPAPGGLSWYPNNYPWPIETVTYANSYSEAVPFGPGGDYTLSASNGLTKYYAPNTGKYVVALVIKEYRNGILIGISTREVQLNVINCPPNSPANLNPQAGVTATNFSVEEGDTLCFDFGFVDPDSPSDSLILTSFGQIFDPTFINPPATITDSIISDPNSADSINATFCWNTDCGQAQALPYIFTVTVEDRGCPPKTTNVVYEITVTEPNPPANIYGGNVFCQNSTGVYTTDNNPNIPNYDWSVFGGVVVQDWGDSIQVLWTNAGTGTVFLSAVNQYGCPSDPISFNATITPAPSVSVGNDTTICYGDSVLLSGTTTATPGFIPIWTSNPSVFPDPTVSTPNSLQTYVTTDDTTKYYLIVDIGGGCFGVDSITVNIDSAQIDAGLDQTICLGDTVQLTASGNGSTFTWTPSTSLSQPNNATTDAYPSLTTQYVVQTSTNANCTNTDAVTVFVSPLPGANANFILNAQAVNLGNDEYRLTSAVNSDTGAIWNSTLVNLNQPFHFDVDLYFGTKDANGADGIAFGLQQLSTQQLGFGGGIGYQGITPSLFVEFDTYQNGSNGDISDDHAATQLNGSVNHSSANNLTPPISLGSGNIEDGLWHNCIFDWDPINQLLTVEFDGTQIINLNYDIINNVFSGTSATYWGFTASTGGSNNEQKVRYNSGTFFNEIIDQIICNNDTVSISAPVSADTYLWEPNNFIDDNTLQNPIFNPSVSTQYVFTGTNSFGCFVKDTFQITVNDLPTVDAGLDQDVCIGDSTSLTANGNAATFSWDNGITDGLNFEVQNTVDYVLTATSIDGCFNYDTVTINALAIPTTFTGETDGYINLCVNDSVQLQGQGADTYLWTPNTFLSDPNIPNPWATPTVATEYILTGTLANGCSNTDTLLIDVNPLPTLSNGGDQTICQGDSVQVQAFGGITFNWISPDSIDDPSISNPTVWPDTTTICYVLVSDVNTCEDTTEVTVFVNPKPTIDAGLDQNICIGDSTSLTANGSAITYTWNNGITDGVNFQVNSTQDYILSGTDANGCSNSDTVTINLVQLPSIDAGNNLSICLNDSIQLNAAGGQTYTWTPATNITDPNIGDPFVFPTTATYYFVTGTDTNGCSNIDSVQVTIDALPTITTSNDTALCIGDTIGILAGGGISYDWLTTDSISDTTVANPNIWPTNSTTYQVYVVGNNNCGDTAEINITVNNLPNIDAGIDIDLCFGDTTQITASGGVTYNWITTTNISNTTSINPDVWPTDTLMYFVSGTDGNQCVNTDSITINVLSLPIADAGPDLWICPGGTIQLNATGGVDYVWTPDSTINNGLIQTPDATPFDNETYVVSVTDINNCTNTDTLFLEVHPNVPTDAGGDTLTICEGTSITLGGSPTSPIGTLYQWSPSVTLNSSSAANPDALPIVPTLFTVNTTNDTCTGVDSVYVRFFPTLVANAGNNVQICIGDSTTLSVSGGDFYQWSSITNSNGDTILINDTIANATAFPSDTTLFYVYISDTNGCDMTDSTLVTVNPLPNFDLGNNTDLCLFDSLSLLASGGDNYAWYPNYNISDTTIANPQVFNEVDTTYYVIVTDSNGCVNTDSITIVINPLPTVTAQGNDTICFGTSTQLIATGALTYVWSPTDSLSNPTIPYPSANPDSNITYIVVGTDANGCTDRDTISVAVLSLPNVDAGDDTTICPGLSVQLNATGGSNYQWTPTTNLSNFLIADPISTPDTLITYVVSTTDTNGCINTDTIIVALHDSADADAGFNQNACFNQGVQLNASGGVAYLWEPSFFVNHDTIASPLAFPDDDMTFTVQVTDSNGCIDFDDVRINVFIANAGNDTIICSGDTIQGFIYGDPATTFDWSPASSVSDASAYDPVLYPTTPTNYIVNIGNAAGCIYTDTLFVDISNPIPSFDTILTPGCDGIIVEYINTSDSQLDFIWNFSDGDTSTDEEVEKVFDFSTNFSATLTVEDYLGCIKNLTIDGSSLTFDDYFNIYYPNVFTPNGDGENDEFIIEVPGRIYECTDLIVYNRWGQVQFISTGNNLKWDGRNSVGGELPNGPYFFTLTVNDGFFSKSGTLYLFK